MSSQHWTLDTAKEKLDPAELQMLKTHYKIEGQKEAVEYLIDKLENMIEVERIGLIRSGYVQALQDIKEDMANRYSHLFDKEVANA